MGGNSLMIQFFEWHVPADGKHWDRLKEKANELKDLGVTSVWIPPPTKGSGDNDVGYGIYDHWDLGEFEQKGTTRTKYGTKQQLKEAIAELKSKGIGCYLDAVLNHKIGADKCETFKAVICDQENRDQEVSEPHDIEGWTGFDFEGRKGKYSQMKWCFNHFTGIDFNNENGQKAIYRIMGENKGWARDVDEEKGNFDFLMGADIDHRHPEVVEDITNWAKWVVNELDLTGFRLDALKHIDAEFIKELLSVIRQERDEFFAVGEYWKNSLEDVSQYIDFHEGKVCLFDVPLHFNLHQASKDGKGYDISKIFDGTLVQQNPINAVTFVDNHDSQPGESLESWVDDWFKPLAYALILLRKDGYPCLFYGDVYGISGENEVPAKFEILEKLCKARKDFAYGDQDDYFDHESTIGWVRHGSSEGDHPCPGLAVVLCSSDSGNKRMFVGKDKAGKEWYDVLGHRNDKVKIDDEGFGEFWAEGGSVSVYTQSQ